MILTGVPIGISRASWLILLLRTSTLPCDGVPGMSPGLFVPRIPTKQLVATKAAKAQPAG